MLPAGCEFGGPPLPWHYFSIKWPPRAITTQRTSMKSYSPDWPSQSIMASAKFKVKPTRTHWSWDSVAAKALAQEKREPRKRLSAAELQARSDARLMARLQEILRTP